jgi:hypothetical protein
MRYFSLNISPSGMGTGLLVLQAAFRGIHSSDANDNSNLSPQAGRSALLFTSSQ